EPLRDGAAQGPRRTRDQSDLRHSSPPGFFPGRKTMQVARRRTERGPARSGPLLRASEEGGEAALEGPLSLRLDLREGDSLGDGDAHVHVVLDLRLGAGGPRDDPRPVVEEK